jgi:membrane dipeptidase
VLGCATVGLPFLNGSRFQLFAGCQGAYSARTIDLVKQSIVIDMLGLLTLDFPKLYAWQRGTEIFSQADFDKLKDSGINVFHPAVGYDGPEAYDDSLRDMERWNKLIAAQPGYFVRVACACDVELAKTSGKIGILLGQQNSEHFRTLADIDRFYALGQRVSLLSYGTNRIGGGSNDARDPGLTEFGAQVIARMNHLGMAVDVAHCGDRTTLDAFTVSRKPVLITHSNCRALVPTRSRCKTDEAIRKMAATGGVIGISMIRGFVSAAGPANVESVLDHVDRVARLVGVEHVGVGSDVDLDGRSHLPASMLRAEHILPGRSTDLDGLNYPKKMFDLTEGLIRRGYGDRDIALILGGNFQRALSEIWKV